MNLFKSFNSQGHFIPKLYYVEKYNILPNIFEITLNDSNYIDVSKINDKFVDRFFGYKAKFWKSTYNNEVSNSSVDEDDDEEIYRFGEFIQTSIKIDDEQNSRFFEISKNAISVYYTGDLDKLEKDIETIRSYLPKLENKPKAAEIGLIAYDQGYYTINSKIVKTDINLEENYNDDFIPVFEDITNFLDSRSSGLVILNGTKGTGKTTFIRFLCSKYPKKYRIVTNAIAARLAEPDFMSYLLSNKDSVFILEDCEQILMDRSENTFGGAIANILNMSDGLMSDIFNIKFICTFNADISKIDSALLRKGRCYANYEFRPLTVDKVKVLSEKNNLGINVTKPMTLAEIYNYESTDYDTSAKPKKKIGF